MPAERNAIVDEPPTNFAGEPLVPIFVVPPVAEENIVYADVADPPVIVGPPSTVSVPVPVKAIAFTEAVEDPLIVVADTVALFVLASVIRLVAPTLIVVTVNTTPLDSVNPPPADA